jgi:hypothetical protein
MQIYSAKERIYSMKMENGHALTERWRKTCINN